MEIEKKYKVKTMLDNMGKFECKVIEQGYLCTEPVVRIRRSNDQYILTYKSKYGIDKASIENTCVSNEVELPLSRDGYEHLKTKIDGRLIEKKRYLVPLSDGLTAELDVFEGYLEGLYFVEVEFDSVETAQSFVPPSWFGEDVSNDRRYKNNYLSGISSLEDELLGE